jgi:hypothetical protein
MLGTLPAEELCGHLVQLCYYVSTFLPASLVITHLLSRAISQILATFVGFFEYKESVPLCICVVADVAT